MPASKSTSLPRSRKGGTVSGPKARANVTDYTLANEHFHSTLVRIGGNAPLAAMLDQLRTPLYRFQFRTRLTAEGLTRGHADHVEIAEAVLAGDPDRAERAMRRHLRNSAKLIDALPDDAFG